MFRNHKSRNFKKINVSLCNMYFFLWVQVSLLIHMNDEFSAEDFCTVIFDEFFFAGLARDNVPKHLLKLLWYIYPKLPTVRLQTLVKALQPTSQVSKKETQITDHPGCRSRLFFSLPVEMKIFYLG